jgi:DNA gyrase/topoisomerase IV subunit B
MPIRGKIINPFKCSKQKFFENEEVQAITMIVFGQEYRKGLTIDDVKVDKIIIMADGDVDRSSCPEMLFV